MSFNFVTQLKHCGKQVFDTLIPLIKNLELQPVQHLLGLVSALEVSAHTESVSDTLKIQGQIEMPQGVGYVRICQPLLSDIFFQI